MDHILSFGFIFAGFTLLSHSWHVLYRAQRRHQLATTGPYRVVRHPHPGRRGRSTPP